MYINIMLDQFQKWFWVVHLEVFTALVLMKLLNRTKRCRSFDCILVLLTIRIFLYMREEQLIPVERRQLLFLRSFTFGHIILKRRKKTWKKSWHDGGPSQNGPKKDLASTNKVGREGERRPAPGGRGKSRHASTAAAYLLQGEATVFHETRVSSLQRKLPPLFTQGRSLQLQFSPCCTGPLKSAWLVGHT